MSKMWKNAVVGTGTVGEWHLRILKDLEHRTGEAKLVAVCDANIERGKQKLASLDMRHVPVFSSVKQMLEKSDCEAVHVCTPSGLHMEPSLQILEAGRHIICEKPIEITLEKIDRMLNAGDKTGAHIAGIFQNRWDPANLSIYDAARSGRFGRITYGASHTPWFRTQEYYRTAGWRGTWALDGGGAMMNQSVHSVDLLQWIVGPIRQVSAYAAALTHPEIEVEDTLTSAVVFENGAMGMMMGATSMWPGGNVRIEVGGENGTAISEAGLRSWRFSDESEEQSNTYRDQINQTITKTSGGGANPNDIDLTLHTKNILHILQSWSNNQTPTTNGHEARKAVAIITALYESTRKNGAPIRVSN